MSTIALIVSFSVVIGCATTAWSQGLNAPTAWEFTTLSQEVGWPQDFPHCRSSENPLQSPIDFSQVGIDFSLRPLPCGDWSPTTEFTISSNQQTFLSIIPKKGIPAISHPRRKLFYRMKEVKVYSPSMHTFGGAHRDLELSLIHELDPQQTALSADLAASDVTKTASQYMAISFTFNAGPLHVENTFLRSIFGPNNSTPTGSPSVEYLSPVNASIKRTVHWSSAVPLSRDYFVYEGSLPQPPCTPSMEHFVFTAASKMTYEQLADVRRVLGLRTTGVDGAVSGFDETDPVPSSSAAFIPDGNYRFIPTPAALRDANSVVSTLSAPAEHKPRQVGRFMDFVGDQILLKQPLHSGFMEDLEMTYKAVYGLAVCSIVISALALRIAVS